MGFILSNALSLVLLALLFHASGRLLESTALRRQDGFWAPFVVRQILGMGAWMVLAFVLAALGLATAGVLFGLVGLAFGLVIMAIGSRRMTLERVVWRDLWPTEWSTSTAAMVVGLLLAALFSQTIWPAVSWDANVYHLTVPRLWAESEGFRLVPFNVYSNWPLNTELLYLVAILVRDYLLAKLIHFWCGILILVAVFWIVSRSVGSLYGWFAAALVLANQVVLAEFRVAYVDLAHGLFFFVSFLLLHAVLQQDRRAPRDLAVVGFVAGLVAGAKLTGIVAVLCLAMLLSLEWHRGRSARVGLLRALSFLMLPSAVVLLAWLAKSWWFTGNPVYPFLYGVFGGPDWSPELTHELRDWQRSIGMGRGLMDYLVLPIRVILMGGRGYSRFDGQIHALWLLWIPLSVWMARRSDLVRRCLWIAGLYFVGWSLTSQQMRFLIPILPFLATAAACSMAELVAGVEKRSRRRFGGALVALVVVSILLTSGGQYMLGGLRLAGVYLKEGATVRDTVVHPVYGFINEQLPPAARLLMVNTNHGFFCHREYVADSFFEASQTRALVEHCDTELEVAELLRAQGFTHILIDSHDWGIPYPAAFRRFLADPGALAQQIYNSDDGRFTLLEVR